MEQLRDLDLQSDKLGRHIYSLCQRSKSLKVLRALKEKRKSLLSDKD